MRKRRDDPQMEVHSFSYHRFESREERRLRVWVGIAFYNAERDVWGASNKSRHRSRAEEHNISTGDEVCREAGLVIGIIAALAPIAVELFAYRKRYLNEGL